MKAKKEYLAYCGFYCGDCLGRTGVIADAARDFTAVLDTYQFGRTVEGVLPQIREDYEKLRETLSFMCGLKCPKVCRERGDAEAPCVVRQCCIEKGFYACHECETFETCETLGSLFGGLHAASCIKNLKGVREMGLDAWIKNGKRHHYWDDPAEGGAATPPSP